MDRRHPLFWHRVHCVIGRWHRLCGTIQVLPDELVEYMIPFVDCIPANYFFFAYPSYSTSSSASSLRYELEYDMARHIHSCTCIATGVHIVSPWMFSNKVGINGDVYDFEEDGDCRITFVIKRTAHSQNPKIHFGSLLQIDCNGFRMSENKVGGRWGGGHPKVQEFDTETHTKSDSHILNHRGTFYAISDFYNQLRCEIACSVHLRSRWSASDDYNREISFRCENVTTGFGFEIFNIVPQRKFAVSLQKETKIEIHPPKSM